MEGVPDLSVVSYENNVNSNGPLLHQIYAKSAAASSGFPQQRFNIWLTPPYHHIISPPPRKQQKREEMHKLV